MKILQWFIAKSDNTKIIVLRIIMGIFLAVVFWIFFFVLGKVLIDQQNTEKFLQEQDWLKFVKVNIRQVIINKYGIFLLGFFIAIMGYKMFSKPASWIVKKYFTSKNKFEWLFQSFFPSLPHPEFIFLLPDDSYPCQLILKNKSEDVKIDAIEIVPAAYKNLIIDHVDRNQVAQALNWARFEVEDSHHDQSDKALAWNLSRHGTFKLDTPFLLARGKTIQVPGIYLTTDEENNQAAENDINNMELEISFQIALNTGDDRYTSNIKAPLRVLIWDEASLSVKGIDEMPPGSNNSKEDYLRMAYDIQHNDAEYRQVAVHTYTRDLLLEDIREWRKKISGEPQNAELHFQLATLLRESLQYEEAMKFMNKAFELGLDSAAFHEERLVTGFASGDTEGIKNSAERLLALRPADADAHVYMGQLLSIEAQPHEALKYFDAAIQLDPNSSSAAYWKSRILNEFEDYKAGLEWLNKSIALDPDLLDAYVERAITLFNLERDEQALDSIRQAIDKGFKDLQWLERIGSGLKRNTKRKFNLVMAPLKN